MREEILVRKCRHFENDQYRNFEISITLYTGYNNPDIECCLSDH